MSDEDRRRKSWREIDRQRERSTHRKEDRPEPAAKRTGPKSQHAYRAALDKLFETGKIADLVEQKAPGTAISSGEGENRIKLLAKIRDALDRDTIVATIDSYLQRFNELPEDMEILGKALEHRSASVQKEAMEKINHLLDREQPKRSRAMLGQLKIIRDVGDDREMTELASKLILRLE